MVFLLGMLFLVGVVEVAVGTGDTHAGMVLMGIAWVGFVVDLGVLWVLDERPRTFARRHVLAIAAVMIPAFRALMAFYVFVRLARGRRALRPRVQLYALYLTILVVTFGAALVLSAERPYPGSNIHTYGEAVWWASVTVATVGYGDYVPVSPTGRLLATLMLVNGVVVISVMTASISSRFVSSAPAGEDPLTLEDIDVRLNRIEAALGALNETRSPGAAPTDDGGTPTPPAPA